MRAIRRFFFGIVAALCWICCEQLSLPNDPFYIGGVVEFPALPRDTQPEDVVERMSQIRVLLEEATTHPDIIVFPESILNNITNPVAVPDPKLAIVPCANTHYDYIITEISCYARSLQIYLLINVIEIESSTSIIGGGGSSTPSYYYNTNVVFDRKGAIISRYRKYNLIGLEWQYFNYSHQPELEATFDTDFNVTFGHFTRMDLLYYRPAQTLVSKGIVDFLHPSKWQSELPFMTAMQLHQSWAYANNVNLLVAGTNDPINGRTGTGIYAGKYGTLTASMTTDETKRKLHLIVLPKKRYNLKANFTLNKTNETNNLAQFTDRITGIQLGRQSDIDLYTTLPLNDTDDCEVHQVLCHGDLCCDFHLQRIAIEKQNTTQPPMAPTHYQYRLAAFKGMGTFLNSEPDFVAVCAVFACIGSHIYTCGRIFDEATLVENHFAFEFIEISGNFTESADSLVLPTSVDGMLKPLPVNEFDFDERIERNISIVTYRLLKPKADLLTFGIYANYFIDESIYDQHKNNKADKRRLDQLIWGLIVICVFGSKYINQYY